MDARALGRPPQAAATRERSPRKPRPAYPELAVRRDHGPAALRRLAARFEVMDEPRTAGGNPGLGAGTPADRPGAGGAPRRLPGLRARGVRAQHPWRSAPRRADHGAGRRRLYENDRSGAAGSPDRPGGA